MVCGIVYISLNVDIVIVILYKADSCMCNTHAGVYDYVCVYMCVDGVEWWW